MWGVKQNIMSRYRKLLKTSSDCQDGCCGKGSCLFLNFKENGEMADVEIFEAHFLFIVYITMSEDGGGGRSKV